MTKKKKESTLLKKLTQEQINKILEIVYKWMSPEARFAFDSRGISVFLQNMETGETSFIDKHTNNRAEASIRICDHRYTIEENIASEIISDVSRMSLDAGYAAYTKYSYYFYDELEPVPHPNHTPEEGEEPIMVKRFRCAKAVS